MLILINNLLKLFYLFDNFLNLSEIRILISVYIGLDSCLVVLMWARKRVFFKIITFKY